MSLAHDGGTWSERARDWLQQRWPRATIHYHNGAIGGTGSGYFALCADAELPPSFDVLLLDHAVNDAEQPVPAEAASLRERAAVYEKLLRGVLRRPGPPAVFFLNWDKLSWCSVLEGNDDITPPDLVRRGPYFHVPWLGSPQTAIESVAAWYDVPAIAPRNAFFHRDCADLSFRGALCDGGGACPPPLPPPRAASIP